MTNGNNVTRIPVQFHLLMSFAGAIRLGVPGGLHGTWWLSLPPECVRFELALDARTALNRGCVRTRLAGWIPKKPRS
jgi:hypothetical protein